MKDGLDRAMMRLCQNHLEREKHQLLKREAVLRNRNTAVISDRRFFREHASFPDHFLGDLES